MARESLTHEDEELLAAELDAESDRAVALLGAGYVDARLADLLEHVLAANIDKKDASALFEGPNAPIGSFSNRIRMAAAMGVIGPTTRADFDIIRSIRNDFAHKVRVKSFADASVESRCQNLKLANISLLGGTPPSSPRRRYIQSVVLGLHFAYEQVNAGVAMPSRPTISP